MRACGIELSASEARIVLLDGAKASYALIDVKPRKLIISDDENQAEVQAFRDALYAFFRENGAERVVIKKRGKSGEYAGGAVGFKLEGIAQLYNECPVVLCAPQTITAALRNRPTEPPEGLPKFQRVAFETAYSALP